MLQCVVMCCSALQCVAVCCSVLHCVVVRARKTCVRVRVCMHAYYCVCAHALHHTATHYNTLQHTATHCNTLQHTATHGNHCNILHHATHCNTRVLWHTCGWVHTTRAKEARKKKRGSNKREDIYKRGDILQKRPIILNETSGFEPKSARPGTLQK